MKMSLVGVKSNKSIEFRVEYVKKPKCKVNNHIRISNYHKVIHQNSHKKCL